MAKIIYTNLETSPEKSAEQLKIGLIVDSPFASKYVYELLEWGQTQKNIVISHLIMQDTASSNPSNREMFINALHSLTGGRASDLISNISFYLINKCEFFLLRQISKHKNHLHKIDLTKTVHQTIKAQPIISRSGFVARYTEEDLRSIKSEKFDVLLYFGSKILRGGILQASRLGVISIHYADNRINRGRPAGFWEVYFRKPSTGFVIQQLTEKVGGGNVLYRGCIMTKYFFLLNQASLFDRCNFYMKKILIDTAASKKLPLIESSQPYFNRLYKEPNISEQLWYSLSQLGRAVGKIYRLVFKNSGRWGVAYQRSDWRSIVMCHGTRIENPPHHFLADPFIIKKDNNHYCFLEDYDDKTRKGCIAVYKIGEKKYERLGEAIVEPFHMSFPYLFYYKSTLYMCPETCQNKDIRLYESTDFPLGWKLSKILMSDISAADTMIFEHDGMWWLFTNIDLIGGTEFSSELFIFYSSSPLSDGWVPHPNNPVIVDSNRGRNAGILFAGNSIFRVSQMQGFETYGVGVNISRVMELNKWQYSEKEVCAIKPNFFKKLTGVHHLHSDGELTVFDCKQKTRIK